MTTVARTLSSRVANFQAVEKSFRYAADPLTRLFDQARLSINSTTVSNVPTSVQDISTIQLRLEGTAAGGAACGRKAARCRWPSCRSTTTTSHHEVHLFV